MFWNGSSGSQRIVRSQVSSVAKCWERVVVVGAIFGSVNGLVRVPRRSETRLVTEYVGDAFLQTDGALQVGLGLLSTVGSSTDTGHG